MTPPPYGPYGPGTGLEWFIQAKSDTIIDPGGRGGRGSIITIRSVFLDQYTGPSDSVNGTFTSRANATHSSGIFIKTPPSYQLAITPGPLPPPTPIALIGV